MVVFTLILSFFSGSLRSPILYKHNIYIHTSNFNVQYGTAILSTFVYISLIQNMKRIQFPILSFMKGPFEVFTFFVSRITRFYTF